jgi:ion channel-forming bestrophin family protein
MARNDRRAEQSEASRTDEPVARRLPEVIEYDPHKWRHHLFQIRGSMLIEISYRVLACVVFATAVVAAHKYWRPLDISDKPHWFVGLAIGLLLVFRTNASYDRFWEGRKLWGSIVNTCRNLARASHVLCDEASAREIIRWVACFPYATMFSLRKERGLGRAASRLTDDEAAEVLNAQHAPLAVTTRISHALRAAAKKGQLDSYQHMQLDLFVAQLVDYLGACERIVRTPLPFAYVVHLRRVLLIYLCTLPLTLVNLFGWWTIVVVLLIAYVLMGIEEIGVEIEDPFGADDNDLPLGQISENIENNVAAFLPKGSTNG